MCGSAFSRWHHPKVPNGQLCQSLIDQDGYCKESAYHYIHMCKGQAMVLDRRLGNDRRKKTWTL